MYDKRGALLLLLSITSCILMGVSFAVVPMPPGMASATSITGDSGEISVKISSGDNGSFSIFAKQLTVENERMIEIIGPLFVTDSIEVDNRNGGRFFVDRSKVFGDAEITGLLASRPMVLYTGLLRDEPENDGKYNDYGDTGQTINLFVGPDQKREFGNVYGEDVFVWICGGLFSADSILATGSIHIYNDTKLDTCDERYFGSAYIGSLSAGKDVFIENRAGIREALVRVGKIRAGNEVRLIQVADEEVAGDRNEMGFISIGERDYENPVILQINGNKTPEEPDQSVHLMPGRVTDSRIYYRWSDSRDFELLYDGAPGSESLSARTVFTGIEGDLRLKIRPEFNGTDISGNTNLVVTLYSMLHQ